MLRLFAVLIGVLSATVLLAELVGIGFLWSKGYLTQQNLYEARLILTGETKSEDARQAEEDKTSDASQKEIQTTRILRVLNLESRGNELELLKSLTEKTANELISDRKTFDEMKANFRKELEEIQGRNQSEAVEQARAVLMASQVDSAVERLMALPMDEAVDLMRGMPDKSIAKFLQGFETPNDGEGNLDPETLRQQREERRTRGQKIFEALSHGEPVRSLIQDTLTKNPEGAAEPPRGGD